MRIAFLFTCYNRIEKTRSCVESIKAAMDVAMTNGIDIVPEWYIVDAGSDDGTIDMLKSCITPEHLHIRVARSDTYYSQGMRICMQMLKDDIESGLYKSEKYADEADNSNGLADESNLVECPVVDYVALINDDVKFYEDFLLNIFTEGKANIVTVGATDYNGKQTYGGIRYRKGIVGKKSILPKSIRYDMVNINDTDLSCHTFNANFVLVPFKIFQTNEIMDKKYIHSLGDFDYGMCMCEKNGKIESTKFYVGECSTNSKVGSWMDASLPLAMRLKKHASVKGAPTGPWFHYLNKHFGLSMAIVHSVSPYVRMIMGK